jgi:lysophospholipase L1-like esterase
MGTNDRGWRVPIDSKDLDSITCFYGAYSYMLRRLKELYPAAEIWCMTFRCQDIFNSVKGGNDIDGYSQVVRGCAAEYGCKLIDLFHYPPYEVYDDNIHASKQGMKEIATAVLKETDNVEK